MSTALRSSRLIENCTPSISYDRQVQSASVAFDRQCYEIIDETGQVCFIPNIMGLTDSKLVDILAWQFHVDFYDKTRDFEFRKNLVQQSITWHMRKGTYDLVQEVLDTYWPGGATISEWFQYYSPFPPSQPPTNWSGPLTAPSWHDRYRFRIYIDLRVIDPADEAKVLDLIDHYKPISRWCEGLFRPTVLSDCNIGWTGAMLRFIVRESEAPDYTPTRRRKS